MRHDLVRILILIVFGVTWWWAYSALNAWNARSDRAVYLKTCPADVWPWLIQPASAVVYVGFAAVLLVWPCALGWRGTGFWSFLAMVSIGTVIGFCTFAIWPLNIQRPDFAGERFGEALMRYVFTVDKSANCFPSFHTFFAVLGAMVVAERSDSFAATTAAALLAVGVMISTITTGQHYLIDVAGGGGLAVISYYAIRFCDAWRSTG
jgi:membrane-associated phospholipid phosphatase